MAPELAAVAPVEGVNLEDRAQLLRDLCRDGHAEEAAALLDQHPELLNRALDRSTQRALHVAVGNRRPNVVKMLLAREGIRVNMPMEHNLSTALHTAARHSVECMELLLAHPEIEVNSLDQSGLSALALAAKYNIGDGEAARLLMRREDINMAVGGDWLKMCRYMGHVRLADEIEGVMSRVAGAQ